MFTEEQRRKAEEALNPLNKLPMFQDFEKEIAFMNHQTAIDWIDTYNLPYRIGLNYLKEYSKQDGFVAINPNYPRPGYHVSDLIHLDPYNDCLAYDPDKSPDEQGRYDLCITPKDIDTRQKIKEHNKHLRPWDLETQEGIGKWKYYFAHFFNGYDLNAFNFFDWFGAKIDAPNEVQQEKINFWKCLQADYYLKPDDFMQEEPQEADYDLDDYTLLEFVPDWKESLSDSKM